MNWLSASVSDFRLRRKCFSISGYLFFICLLIVIATVTCRPSDEIYDGFDANEDNTQYGDVDNVEFHHVKIVDGIMQEDHHPVVMYKEDFVSEDYDASKNRTAVERKYKDIAHHRRRVHRVNETQKYRALKPKKIYFDILPQTPLVVEDDSLNNDSKFDPSNIRVDVLSLLDTVENNTPAAENLEQNKQALNKHPKKYHSRSRRSATDAHAEHVVRKRNPYFLHSSPTSTSVNSLPNVFMLPQYQAGKHVKHQVPGKLWNAINLIVEIPPAVPGSIDDRFGGSDNSDIVYWPPSGSGKGTRRPAGRPSTSPPLFHDITTARPSNTGRTPPPLFHDSNPDNADFSLFRRF